MPSARKRSARNWLASAATTLGSDPDASSATTRTVLAQPAGDLGTEHGEARVGDDEAAAVVEAPEIAPQRLAFADARDRALGERSEPDERGDGLGAARRVGHEAGVPLELAQRGLGLGAEDAVLAARVEAEPVQAPLELGDVVAAQHGPAQVEQPVAEAVRALDERAPGLGSADAVDAGARARPGTRARRLRSRRRTRRRARS